MAEMTLSAKLAVSVYLFYYTPVVKHFLCHRRIVHKSDILFYFISDYIKRKRFLVALADAIASIESHTAIILAPIGISSAFAPNG